MGPLFQGRYKGILVERGYHYWALSRYIHLNPVRAGMVDDPEKYRWSSCHHFYRCKGRPPWLAWEEVAEVCREYGVSRDQTRMRGIKENEPRSVAIFLSRKLTRVSIYKLGNYFGGVKGAAISNMSAKIRDRLIHDTQFRAKLGLIEESIKNVK